MSAAVRFLAARLGDLFNRRAQHATDQIFRLGDAILAIQFFLARRAIAAISCVTIRFFRQDRRAIEHEIPALLVQNREAVEAKGVPQEIDRRVWLLDNAQQRGRIGNRNRASFGAAAQVLEQ